MITYLQYAVPLPSSDNNIGWHFLDAFHGTPTPVRLRRVANIEPFNLSFARLGSFVRFYKFWLLKRTKPLTEKQAGDHTKYLLQIFTRIANRKELEKFINEAPGPDSHHSEFKRHDELCDELGAEGCTVMELASAEHAGVTFPAAEGPYIHQPVDSITIHPTDDRIEGPIEDHYNRVAWPKMISEKVGQHFMGYVERNAKGHASGKVLVWENPSVGFRSPNQSVINAMTEDELAVVEPRGNTVILQTTLRKPKPAKPAAPSKKAAAKKNEKAAPMDTN